MAMIKQVVMVQSTPEYPDSTRRECLIEVKQTGELIIAVYNEFVEEWHTAYGNPAPTIPPLAVGRWCYIDEIFNDKIK